MSPPFAIAVRCVDSQLLPLERTINQGASLAVVTNWLVVVAGPYSPSGFRSRLPIGNDQSGINGPPSRHLWPNPSGETDRGSGLL
jgi:hypothetical protein